MSSRSPPPGLSFGAGGGAENERMKFTSLVIFARERRMEFEQIGLKHVVLCRPGKLFTLREVWRLTEHGWLNEYYDERNMALLA